MSGSASQTPVVSPDYLSAMRQYLRITAGGFFGGKKAPGLAPPEDLTLKGGLPGRGAGEKGPLF